MIGVITELGELLMVGLAGRLGGPNERIDFQFGQSMINTCDQLGSLLITTR
jgi:hypothetical protein